MTAIVLAFVAGFSVAFCFNIMANNWEWSIRRHIDNRLKYLESKLLCGQGIFGCKGGPDCDWDHK